MKSIRIIGIATIMLLALLAVPIHDFAKVTTKKKKMTVSVGGDCGIGVLLSVGTSGDALCATYPKNAVGMLRQHVGQTIEIEAIFQYSGDPKDAPPNGVRKVTRVAGAKVYDPCSTANAIAWGLTGNTSLPPGCAESLDTGDATAAQPADDSSSSAAVADSATTAPRPAVGQDVASYSPRLIRGVPQCTRTQSANQGINLWIVNTCNITVTVEFTSDSGNTWGQGDVGPNSRIGVSAFGMGYDPRKDGSVYLFTCPKGSQPVMPNGSPFLARNYRGQFTCAQQ